MSESPFTPAQVRERYGKVMPSLLVAGALVLLVAGWGLYAAKAGAGINVVGMSDRRAKELRQPQNTNVELALAVLATAVAPYLLWKATSLRRLALHGHEAVGRIVKASSISKGGSTPVTIEYVVAGVTHTAKKDYPSGDAVEGGEVRVIYDPGKPSRCLVI